MNADEEFRSLLDRVGQNDEAAIAELVHRYEPEIRIMVRAWLRPWELRMRKVFDSQDICQSVLAWFFLKGATQRYDLSSPDNLRSLLRVMVRNRVFYRIRGNKQAVRAVPIANEMECTAISPEAAAEEKDLVETVLSRFTAEEADLAQRRYHGASWEEISAQIGGTPDGRRMQLARATNRLAQDLALSK